MTPREISEFPYSLSVSRSRLFGWPESSKETLPFSDLRSALEAMTRTPVDAIACIRRLTNGKSVVSRWCDTDKEGRIITIFHPTDRTNHADEQQLIREVLGSYRPFAQHLKIKEN